MLSYALVKEPAETIGPGEKDNGTTQHRPQAVFSVLCVFFF